MIEKLTLWLDLAAALGTDIIQIPSNFSSNDTTGDTDKIVADIREIAELAAQRTPVVRLAYEALAWGLHVDLWQQSWDIVTKSRPPQPRPLPRHLPHRRPRLRRSGDPRRYQPDR